MPETRARDLANLAGAGATSSTVAYHETARAFTLPAGAGDENQVISSNGNGTTDWKVTVSAPEITGVTGDLNKYESSGSTEDGGTLSVSGTGFGTIQSDITSVKIMDSNGNNAVTASSWGTPTATALPNIVFDGDETGYNAWGTGSLENTNWHIQVTKSGLTSNVFSSGKSFTQDPAIASITRVASGDNTSATITQADFGTYGYGQGAGGGQDSSTKLLLNFDRASNSTDFEDSSNIGGDGHKVTEADNAKIITSGTYGRFFGRTNQSMGASFDGTGDYLAVNPELITAILPGTAINTNDWTHYCVDAWIRTDVSLTGTHPILLHTCKNGFQMGVGFYYYGGNLYGGLADAGTGWNTTTNPTNASAITINTDTWYHCLWHMYWQKNTGDTANPYCYFYLDGTFRGKTSGSSSQNDPADYSDLTSNSSTNFVTIGGKRNHAGTFSLPWDGYIDCLRVSNVDVTADSTDPLYSSTAFGSHSLGTNYFTPPTKIYGKYGPDNPDVGTIEITASTTDDVDVDFSFQGTGHTQSAVTNSGLTLSNDGWSGYNATNDKKKARITGTLNGTVGTITNLRIQAKANNDNTRLVELDETNGTGSTQIIKVGSNKPTLFNARRYVGNQSTSRQITGFGFQPDLVWVKDRTSANYHALYDSVRGPYLKLSSDQNGGNASSSPDGVISFDSDGATIGWKTGWGFVNANQDYIAWAWKAGGAPSGSGKRKRDGTETDLSSGTDYSSSISSMTQSVNVDGDFSITKYTGNVDNADGWIKHDLTGAPDFVIIKNLDATDNWICYHTGLGVSTGNTSYIQLNENQQQGYYATGSNTQTLWTSAGITNDKINLDGALGLDWVMNDESYICYAWKAVADVSAFGTYEGNAIEKSITDVGFTPKFIMIKRIDGGGEWFMYDTFRGTGTSNVADGKVLGANDAAVENWGSTQPGITVTSTGWTMQTSNQNLNGSGMDYIYMAIA